MRNVNTDKDFFEQFYERVILPQYNNPGFRDVVWIDHGVIGEHYDVFTHYFRDGNKNEYVLVFEDYPSNEIPFADGMSHEVIFSDNRKTLLFSGKPPFRYVENITGYFTLFREMSDKQKSSYN